MEQYIITKLNLSDVAKSTINKRISDLKKLAEFFPKSNDFSFLNNTNKITKILNKLYPKITTRATVLFSILSAIKSDPNIITQEAKNYYNLLSEDYNRQKAAYRDDNRMNDIQKIKLEMPLKERQAQIKIIINEFLNKYDITDKITNNQFKLIPNKVNFLKEFQELLVCSLYILQPAIRNDYAGLVITNKKKDLNTNDNYLYIRSNKFILLLNKFKNVGVMGSQEIEIKDQLLKRLITLWLSCLKYYSKFLDIPIDQYFLYYTIARNKLEFVENRDTLRRAISKFTSKILGQELSINDFRHLWEMSIQRDINYPNLTLADKNEIHRQLLHAPGTALEYNLI